MGWGCLKCVDGVIAQVLMGLFESLDWLMGLIKVDLKGLKWRWV